MILRAIGRDTNPEAISFAFIDDDAVEYENWCATVKRVFEDNPVVAACTGRVDPLLLETEAPRLFEGNGGYSRGEETIRLPRDSKRRSHL